MIDKVCWVTKDVARANNVEQILLQSLHVVTFKLEHYVIWGPKDIS